MALHDSTWNMQIKTWNIVNLEQKPYLFESLQLEPKMPTHKIQLSKFMKMSISSPTRPVKSTSASFTISFPKLHRNHAILHELFPRLKPIIHSPCDLLQKLAYLGFHKESNHP